MSISNDDVSRAQQGDLAALDRLIRALTPQVERTLRRFPLTDEDQRDALQNTLMRVCAALGSYREQSRFSTWLYRVSANEALMLLRKARSRGAREKAVDPEAIEEHPAALPDEGHDDDHAELRRALDRLPEMYRSAVVAYYGEGRPLREIAGEAAGTESAVRARVHRARQMLRNEIDLMRAG